MNLVTHDRGLGTAYERYCFYQRLKSWAKAYRVESFLEGPLDGMAGVAGVHGVGLALDGLRVVTAIDTAPRAEIARGVYERAGVAKPDVRVVSPDRLSDLPQADMVLAYHALPMVEGWRSYLRALGKLARKVLIVTVCNPENWGVVVIRTAARVRGIGGMEPPETWQSEVLGPELRSLGKLDEHAFFDCPWWPDLQVAPGQTLADRARQLLRQRKKNVRFTADDLDVKHAERFVYGVERWPYFGGEGWQDELMPALLRHPGFDGSRTPWLRYLAHLHAFVVDTSDRAVRDQSAAQEAR